MFKMNKIIWVLTLYFLSEKLISVHPAQNTERLTKTHRITPYQQTQLEKFRTIVADLLDDDYERSDEYLLGFLINKNWKIFSAEQMLRIAKNWRESHNIKELAKVDFSQELLTRFPVKIGGYDKRGCPLVQVYFGSWNVADYISNQEFVRDGMQNVLKHFRQSMAKAELLNRDNFPKCRQTMVIASIANYSSTHFADVNSISTFVRMFTDYGNYFPSFLFEVHGVEVPDIFKPILELLRTTVNEELYYGGVKIHNGVNWKQDLYNLVNIVQLSKKLGGTADDI